MSPPALRLLLLCGLACGWNACLHYVPDPGSDFGFRATYDDPGTSTGSRAGRLSSFSNYTVWSGGPREDFLATPPSRLARESLEWFRSSSDAEAWRGNPTANLELLYPSGAQTVLLRYDASRGAWEDQLRDWMMAFPPGGSGEPLSPPDGTYSWSVEVDGRGRVDGVAATAEEAIRRMRSIHRDLELLEPSAEPLFALGIWTSTGSSRSMSGVGGVPASELDELPGRLPQ